MNKNRHFYLNTVSFYEDKLYGGINKMTKKLYLSDIDRKIGGVCGGIGEYFSIDPTLIRLIWMILVLFGGTGIIAYFIAWAIIPRRPGF